MGGGIGETVGKLFAFLGGNGHIAPLGNGLALWELPETMTCECGKGVFGTSIWVMFRGIICRGKVYFLFSLLVEDEVGSIGNLLQQIGKEHNMAVPKSKRMGWASLFQLRLGMRDVTLPSWSRNVPNHKKSIDGQSKTLHRCGGKR